MAEKLAQMSIHEKLTRLARNLWWSWDPEVTDVFRLIDPELWEKAFAYRYCHLNLFSKYFFLHKSLLF